MTALAAAEAPPSSARRVDGDTGAGYHGIFELGELVGLASSSLAAAAKTSGPSARQALIDAFLAVASLSQVVGDHVHRDLGDLNRIAKYSSRLPGPAGLVAGGLFASSARIGQRLRSTRERSSVDWLAQNEEFADRLAGTLWGGASGHANVATLSRRWARVAVPSSGLPSQLVAIPPRCFFSFDQRPEDCVELAARFAGLEPDRDRAVLVVGIRTSGCFMAPVVAASLRALGFNEVEWISWRPGQARLARDGAVLARAAHRRMAVLVVDDPPTSGGSIARVAAELAAAGVSRDRITLLLQLFPAAGRWQERLAPWRKIQLDWEDWHIQDRLQEAAVAADLAELLEGRQLTVREGLVPNRQILVAAVEGVARLPIDRSAGVTQPANAREHVRASYRARIRAEDGSRFTHDVFVKGIGLGMFGERASAAAHRLARYVPEVYGVKDGLMYREWLSHAHAVDESDLRQRQMLARGIGRYSADRALMLPVGKDVSSRLTGHDALWEQLSRWLGDGFGRLALPMRPLLHASGRRLVRAVRPSVIDGATGPGHWFTDGGALVKSGWDERAFVYQVPFCYDAAYDVAVAAVQRLPDNAFGELARSAYEQASGSRIDDVRWFLYRMLSELDRQALTRTQPATEASSRSALVESLTEGERRATALHRAFLSDAYLGDVRPPEAGGLCAIDVDGVLESVRRSYSAPAAAGLLALRALVLHGYRPLIATGRSLDEAVLRCRDYRLAGAVAEYGAVIHDAATAQTKVLLSPGQALDLEALRRTFARVEGVELDAAYRYSVRAFTVRHGRRCAISAAAADTAVAGAGLIGRIRIVNGWAQTDFVPAGVDKGTGLRALAELLGAAGERPLALAVGDSLPDLPMFELARVAAAPANADAALNARGRVKRCGARFGAGLAEAVAMVIGHSPGRCSICAAPGGTDPESCLLLALLRVGDEHGVRKLAAVARAMRL